MATVNGKILAVPPGVSVAEHIENHSTPSRGSPIQVGGQGRGESEDAIRELYGRELRDAEDKIATLKKKEQVMKNVMGMRDVAWKSAYEQALMIAKVAGLQARRERCIPQRRAPRGQARRRQPARSMGEVGLGRPRYHVDTRPGGVRTSRISSTRG